MNEKTEWKLIATISGNTKTEIDFSKYSEIFVVGKFSVSNVQRMLSFRILVPTLTSSDTYVYGDGGAYTNADIYSGCIISLDSIQPAYYAMNGSNYIASATTYVYAR